LIEACVAGGTAHLRTHVNIDLESRLAKLDGVLAAPERYCGRAGVQIVTFPQSGVMRCPGVLDLLDAAVQSGAAASTLSRSHEPAPGLNRGSSTASSPSLHGMVSGSTSTCTSRARWAFSMSRRSVPAPARRA
jgi:cytosine/adenosine deaminase-related metal-dependent hydrolase